VPDGELQREASAALLIADVCIAAQTRRNRGVTLLSAHVRSQGMNSTRPITITFGPTLGGQLAFARGMSGYRAYVLETGVDTVGGNLPTERLGGRP